MTTKKPLRSFRTFPTVTEHKMQLMLNVLRHEPSLVILGFFLNENEVNPNQIEEILREEYHANISVKDCLEDVLEPAHMIEKKIYHGSDGLANIPISLVKYGKRKIEYTPSRAYKRYGEPAAHFTLRYCVDNDIMLGDLFGRNCTDNDNRATLRRYRMLKTMYEERRDFTKGGLSIDTFVDMVTIEKELSALENLDLISIETQDVDKFISTTFKWKYGKSIDAVEKTDEYTQQVARVISRGKHVSKRNIADGTGLSYEIINSALAQLRSQGIIVPTHTAHIDTQYQIRIEERGVKLWEEYFKRLHDFLGGGQQLPLFPSREAASDYIGKALMAYRHRSK